MTQFKQGLHFVQVFAQLVCSFRYGREEDETMGLNFKKELTLADEQVQMQQMFPIYCFREKRALLFFVLLLGGSLSVPFQWAS